MTENHESGSNLPVAPTSRLRRSAARLIRADTGGFVLTVALGVAAAALALAPPWLVGVVIDRIEQGTTVAEIDRLGLALVALAVLQTFVSRYSHLVTSRFGERTSRRLRRTMVDRVLALPPRVVDAADSGDLMVRATTDVQRVTRILSTAAPEVLVASVQVVLTFAFVVVLSPLLALVAIVGMLGVVFVVRWYLRRATPAYLAEAAVRADFAEHLTATISGARTVEMYGLQQSRLEEDLRLARRTRHAQLATLRLRTVLFPSVDTSYVIALVLVMIVGAAMYADGGIGLGALVAILLYVRQLSAPLDTVLLWLESLQNGIASFARIEGLAALTATREAAIEAPTSSDLTVQEVSFRYGNGPTVLRDVNLDVTPGEHLAVVGASGAGKSTLARLLAGLEHPTHGSVLLGGAAAASLPIETRRSHLALVTQDQHVFGDTVRTNLLLGCPSANDDELRAAMRTVRADWLDQLPDGLDSDLSGAHELAGAHAQQLALARVILTDPQTLVLDEATSLLTPGSAREAERSLGSLLDGRTVITIAHRLSTARDADRIAVMDGGEIREVGSHEDLLRRDGLYADLWRAWHVVS